MKNRNRFFVLLLAISIVAGCKFPDLRLPRIKGNADEVYKQLRAPGQFENLSIIGLSNNFNGQKSRILKLTLINGHKVPAASDQLEALAKQELKLLLENLENTSDYDGYQVTFHTENNVGFIKQSSNRSYKYVYEDIFPADTLATPVDTIVPASDSPTEIVPTVK